MGIHVLPQEIAAQIAAGEVVERPASVVKELVENSIDAGASDVRVEVERGGQKLLRIGDDGCGIPAAEVEIAFHRHSTSKLSTVEDLDHIATLGFRGEALASIAAVSRVTLATRARAEETGTLLRLEGGVILSRQPTGRPPGTAITVEDLFYNVPARRKFLRAETTERRHIDAWITRYALAYPNLRLTLTHEGRETFRSPGNGNLRDVLTAVNGVEVARTLLEIPDDPGGDGATRVQGLVSPPSLHRANRGELTFFVNGRWVQDTRLTFAVVQAYHTLLPTGRYPLAVLMITLSPEEVDVNVHPAKSEVRFRDGEAVFRAVQRAVRQTISGRAPVPTAHSPHPGAWAGQRASGQRPPAWRPEPDEGVTQLALLPTQQKPSPGMPPLRVLGQAAATYIVAEGPDGLYLVDQHAAHERVLYEQLMARRAEGAVSQRLLDPEAVDLSPELAGLVEAHLDALQRLGFALEPFGGNAYLVRALPVALAHARPSDVLPDVAAGLEEGRSLLAEEAEGAIARRVCKRAAVKAGQALTLQEMEDLLRALERCASPRTCPHGRPTMIHLSIGQLTSEFGRG